MGGWRAPGRGGRTLPSHSLRCCASEIRTRALFPSSLNWEPSPLSYLVAKPFAFWGELTKGLRGEENLSSPSSLLPPPPDLLITPPPSPQLSSWGVIVLSLTLPDMPAGRCVYLSLCTHTDTHRDTHRSLCSCPLGCWLGKAWSSGTFQVPGGLIT